MEQYTDLKWGIVTDPRRVNCLSDEPSTFHVVQSSVLQFASQEDTATGVTKQRHRRPSTWPLHSTRWLGEDKMFSFAGGVTSCLEFAAWRGFGKNSCRNMTFWVRLQFRTGRERRQLSGLFRSATLLFASSVTAWVTPSRLSFKCIWSRLLLWFFFF